MDNWEDRVLNGVLKSGVVDDPAKAKRLLSADVELLADPARAKTDLWPAIWAAAAALSRQFSGRIFIRCGLDRALPAPAALGPRCEFSRSPHETSIKVGIGVFPGEGPTTVWGDVRGRALSYGANIRHDTPAHPISAFALAGYLSYAALAGSVQLPSHRDDYTVSELVLPIHAHDSQVIDSAEITFVGLGQLGQAYLALLFFLTGGKQPGKLVLIDRDIFEAPNESTQILLDWTQEWLGEPKATFLAAKLRRLGWNALGEQSELTWEWRKPPHHPSLAVLGLDDLDVRRMAVAAGYKWIVEAGVGTSFLEPRISWHSLPCDTQLARRLFASRGDGDFRGISEVSPLARQLKATPGECGWVTFNNIRATAPSMGIVAAAYAWCSLLAVLQGEQRRLQGRACLWNPLLPFLEESV